MSHLTINIPSDIYYSGIGSKIIRFTRTTSYLNSFVTLYSLLLKGMQKQGSKHRFIISLLNKVFGKHFTSSYFHCLEQELQNYAFACFIFSFCFVLFFCFLFCLFVSFLCIYHVIIAFVSFALVSMYLQFFMFLWVGILNYYKFYYNLIFYKLRSLSCRYAYVLLSQ